MKWDDWVMLVTGILSATVYYTLFQLDGWWAWFVGFVVCLLGVLYYLPSEVKERNRLK